MMASYNRGQEKLSRRDDSSPPNPLKSMDCSGSSGFSRDEPRTEGEGGRGWRGRGSGSSGFGSDEPH